MKQQYIINIPISKLNDKLNLKITETEKRECLKNHLIKIVDEYFDNTSNIETLKDMFIYMEEIEIGKCPFEPYYIYKYRVTIEDNTLMSYERALREGNKI